MGLGRGARKQIQATSIHVEQTEIKLLDVYTRQTGGIRRRYQAISQTFTTT